MPLIAYAVKVLMVKIQANVGKPIMKINMVIVTRRKKTALKILFHFAKVNFHFAVFFVISINLGSIPKFV